MLRIPPTDAELAARTLLLETVRQQMRARSTNQMARWLGFDPAHLWRVKTGLRPFGDTLILAIHDATGMPIAKIKWALAADIMQFPGGYKEAA